MIFVGHGAPTTALDAKKGAEMARVLDGLPTPKAILCVSAHWAEDEPTLGTTTVRKLIYDFHGFPEQLSHVQYPSPGAPELAARVRELLRSTCAVREAPERGLDHGVWAPLVHLVPGGTIPVLQLSLAFSSEPERLVALGSALAPLHDEGVLLMGSGNVVHNLRAVDWNERQPPPGWALEFDAWCEDTLKRGDLNGLAAFTETPSARLAHPTTEHFLPLLVVAGAAKQRGLVPRTTLTGFEYGSIGRRCVQWAQGT